MVNHRLPRKHFEVILAVSGGPDSVYLVDLFRKKSSRFLVAHYNHAARGRDSEADQEFLDRLCKNWGLSMEVGRAQPEAAVSPLAGRKGKVPPRFEEKARKSRYSFLKNLLARHKAKKILVAQTADDQVETVLMRILEGAGITGLKGIPRVTKDAIERPLLDTWRKEILAYLEEQKIPYRIDKSNLDIRFERNWIRHVLIPLLEKRYGKSLKKRIFALGERFRELDVYIDQNAWNWLDLNDIYRTKAKEPGLPPGRDGREEIRIPRKSYAALPSILRIRILQILCFRRIGTSPNERLLESMDRMIVSGSPSARLSVGKGATLRCRYGEAILSPPGKMATTGAEKARLARTGKGVLRKDPREKLKIKTGKKEGKIGAEEPILRMEGPGTYRWNQPAREAGSVETGFPVPFFWTEKGKTAKERLRKMAEGERQAAFDAERIPIPLFVRPLRAGDRVRPFGLGGTRKVKDILIDRKVPREERWGRPVVCDALGRIVWIPGVLRSADVPVTATTRRTIVLRADIRDPLPPKA